MSIKRIEVGPRMSQAVVHGDTVYVAGQVARQPRSLGRKADPPDPGPDRQAPEAGRQQQGQAAEGQYLALRHPHFDEMNKVWDSWVSQGNTPARATVEARLAGPQYLVEIMVTAAL